MRKAGKLAADEIKTLPKGTIPMEVHVHVYVHVRTYTEPKITGGH